MCVCVCVCVCVCACSVSASVVILSHCRVDTGGSAAEPIIRYVVPPQCALLGCCGGNFPSSRLTSSSSWLCATHGAIFPSSWLYATRGASFFFLGNDQHWDTTASPATLCSGAACTAPARRSTDSATAPQRPHQPVRAPWLPANAPRPCPARRSAAAQGGAVGPRAGRCACQCAS